MSPATSPVSKTSVPSSSSSSRPIALPTRYRHHQDRHNDAVAITVSKSSPPSRTYDSTGSSSFLFPTRSAEGSPQRRSCEWRRKRSEDATGSTSSLAATKQLEISAPYDPKRGSRPLARNCHFSPPATRPVEPERRVAVVKPGGVGLNTGGNKVEEGAPTETADADCHHRTERRGLGNISGGSTCISRVRSAGCSPHSRKPERKPSIYRAKEGLIVGERRRSSGLSAVWLAKNREQGHWDRRRGDVLRGVMSNIATVTTTTPRPLPTSPPGHGAIPDEPLHSPRCKSPLCAPAAAAREAGRAAEADKTPARYRRKKDSKVSLPPVMGSKASLPPPSLSPTTTIEPDSKPKPAEASTSPDGGRHSHEKPAPKGSCRPCTGGMGFPFGTMEESSRGRNLGSPAPEEKRKVAFMDGLIPPLEKSSRMEEILRRASPEPETGLWPGVDEVSESSINSARPGQVSRKNSGGISWLKNFLLNPFGGKRSDDRDDESECSTGPASGERDTSEDDTPRPKSSVPQYLPRCGSQSEEPGHIPARRSSMPARKASVFGAHSQTPPEPARRKSSAYVPTRRSSAMRPVLNSCQEDLTEAQAKRLSELRGLGLDEADARRCLEEELRKHSSGVKPFGHVTLPTGIQARRRTPWPGAEEFAKMHETHGLDAALIP